MSGKFAKYDQINRFEVKPDVVNLLNKFKLSLIIVILLEFNSAVEISIYDPGDIFKLTFVDLMFVTRFISQSILL